MTLFVCSFIVGRDATRGWGKKKEKKGRKKKRDKKQVNVMDRRESKSPTTKVPAPAKRRRHPEIEGFH